MDYMVSQKDYSKFYRIACNMFESGFKFINEKDDNYYFMNVASIKLLKHLNTTEMLMANTLEFNHLEKSYLYYDNSSVIALLRVSYENLVVIAYHFFGDEIDHDIVDWYKLLGYRNRGRNKLRVSSVELDNKILQEQEIMDELTSRLELNNFKGPKKYDWKPKSWYELGNHLNMPKFLYDKYSFWSSHSHSGFDTLMQENISHTYEPLQEIKRNEINYLFMSSILVFFIEGYAEVLSKLGYPYISDFDLSDVRKFSDFVKAYDKDN